MRGYNFNIDEPTLVESPISFVDESMRYTESTGHYKEGNTFLKSLSLHGILFTSSVVTGIESLQNENSWAHNKMLSLKKSAKKNNFELPNEFVISLSKEALGCIYDNNATLLFCNPIANGGALIEFKKNDVHFILEIDNDSDIALLQKSQVPLVEDLTPETLLTSLQSSLENA
jgi:hypothetical protein